MSLRRLYERRFRRRHGDGKELLLNSDGNPRLAVVKGELVGVRATDGSVIPIPERRVEDVPDEEWVWAGGWRKRWID